MSNTTRIDGLSLSVYDSYAEKRLVAALYGSIFVAGVLGNSSVLLSMVLSRKPRTTTNVFVVNLAVADFITCLSLPINALSLLSESREKLLVSDNLCVLQGFILIVCIGCSFNNIASTAVYRALITSRKSRSRLMWFFNRRGLAAIVATTWLIPVAIGIPPIVSEFGSYGYDLKFSTCTFNPTARGSVTYTKVMPAVLYPVQLLTTFGSYLFILFTVKKHFRRVKTLPERPLAAVSGSTVQPLGSQPGSSRQAQTADREAPPTTTNKGLPLAASKCWGGGGHSPVSRSSSQAPAVRQPLRQAGPEFRRNLDVTITLFLVVFCFVVCCAPYAFVIAIVKDKSQKFIPFLGAVLVGNSCINPIIYAARHPDFKDIIRCIMSCRFHKIPVKSAFLLRLLRSQG